jgi:hypothetical protein
MEQAVHELRADLLGSDFVNMQMAAKGCTSGRIDEWPVLRAEIRRALDEIAQYRVVRRVLAEVVWHGREKK